MVYHLKTIGLNGLNRAGVLNGLNETQMVQMVYHLRAGKAGGEVGGVGVGGFRGGGLYSRDHVSYIHEIHSRDTFEIYSIDTFGPLIGNQGTGGECHRRPTRMAGPRHIFTRYMRDIFEIYSQDIFELSRATAARRAWRGPSGRCRPRRRLPTPAPRTACARGRAAPTRISDSDN